MYYWYELFDAMDSLAGILGALSALYAVCVITALIAGYTFPRYALYLRGKKAGVNRGWRAFVPFFSVRYKVQIMDEPWWKILFFDEFKIICYAIIALLGFAYPRLIVVFAILSIGYFIAAAVFNIKYYCGMFEAFGYSPMLGFFHWIPGINVIPVIIEYALSFDSRRQFGGNLASFANETIKGEICGLTGKYQGALVKIAEGETIVFGRDGQICNVVFDPQDEHVSRKHCSVSLGTNHSFLVTDFSSNGTLYDDGRRFPRAIPVPVPKGTVICIGSKAQRFRLD